MAELEQRVQQLEREARELQATLKTDRERIDRLTSRVDRFAPEILEPSAEDIKRSFGGRVFGVLGHSGKALGWGGGPGDPQSPLLLSFTVQGERVYVETATVDPGEHPLVRLALNVLMPIDSMGMPSRPPLPVTLTLEERAARLRVCGREHDFKSYACGDRSIAFAPVGDLWVTVELPTEFLDNQAFELDDDAEFRWGDEP